jgi:hypothetical protein
VTEDNLVYRVGTHAFNINGGANNITRNNIFGPTHNADKPFIRCYLRKHQAENNTLTGNIMYCNGDVLVDSAWDPAKCHADGNLYWNFAGKPVTFAGKTFQEWQAMGQDVHSRIADPQFVDPANGDFTLRKTSPALAMGFKPFDPHAAGLQPAFRDLDNPPPVVSLPPIYTMDVPAERTMPFGFDLDFEDVPLGLSPREFNGAGFSDKAKFAVTDETAASGKRCLKATDTVGLKRNFYPYISCSKERKEGVVHLSFDLKLKKDQPAQGTLTIRDYPTAKTLGKEFIGALSLSFAADGQLKASGQSLGTMPLGEWTHFDLRLPVGDKASGDYELAITMPGTKPKLYTLPIDSKDFHVFSWVGFIADGETDGTFYLDNLVLRADK